MDSHLKQLTFERGQVTRAREREKGGSEATVPFPLPGTTNPDADGLIRACCFDQPFGVSGLGSGTVHCSVEEYTVLPQSNSYYVPAVQNYAGRG